MSARFVICLALLAIFGVTIRMAGAQGGKIPAEPGSVTYHGSFDGAVGDLTIGPPHGGKSRISISAGGPGCGEDVSGLATVQGNVLTLTNADDGSDCRLTITVTQAGATVKEQSCMTWHGASCDFDSWKRPLRRMQ